MRRFWEEFVEPWESVRLEADDFVDTGEGLVTQMTTYHRGREGIEVHARASWLWTIRDGRVASVIFFQGREEALEAAGLSE